MLRNIAIKLATSEVTKLCATLITYKKSNFELTIWENMQQNIRIKISCQN